MIEAVIFDMDGLMIDSEPFWRESEPVVLNKVGVPMTANDAFETTGLRIDEVVKYWHRKHPWDLQKHSIAALSDAIVDEVIARVSRFGKPLPGLQQIIDFFRDKHLPLALASSSPDRLIVAILEKLELRNDFPVIHSAEHEAYGKPHPAVFLHTANLLNVTPEHCLVLEDSLNGVIAAKAAKMRCIAVPEAHFQKDIRFSIADMQLPSLEAFNETIWQRLNKG